MRDGVLKVVFIGGFHNAAKTFHMDTVVWSEQSGRELESKPFTPLRSSLWKRRQVTAVQRLQEGAPGPDDRSETSQGTVVNDGKFSMMEFALLNFRESIDKWVTPLCVFSVC